MRYRSRQQACNIGRRHNVRMSFERKEVKTEGWWVGWTHPADWALAPPVEASRSSGCHRNRAALLDGLFQFFCDKPMAFFIPVDSILII